MITCVTALLTTIPVQKTGRNSPLLLLPDFFRRKPPQLGNLARCLDDEGRLIAFSPMRHRRQGRRVGLDEHAIQRHYTGGIANVLCLGKRDVAGKGNNKAEIERGPRVLHRSREAVQHAAQAAGGPILADQAQHVIPGVLAVVRWAAVDDDGEAWLRGPFPSVEERPAAAPRVASDRRSSRPISPHATTFGSRASFAS